MRFSMTKIKLWFMLTVLDFISDWYSANRNVPKKKLSFNQLNELRGHLRDHLEEEGI